MEAAVPAIGVTVSSHWTVTPFNAKLEQWSEYAERLELIANDIVTPAKLRAILLHAVGPAMYKLLKTLASPTPVTELTFEELVEKAKLHFMCRKKAKEAKDKDKPEHAHVVNETPTEEKGEYGMFNMNTGSSKPFQAVVKVNGTPITMEIDTGASASIVSEETFKSLQSGQLRLDQASVRLFTYTGESICNC